MSKRASRTRHALVGYAFLSPALIGVLLFMVVPIGVIMWVSLYRWDLIGDTRYVGLANVTNVLSDPSFLSSLRTTILFVLLVVPIQIILGILLANLLTKGVRGTVVYRTLIVIPWIAPPLALGVVWSWIFAPTGGLLSALAGTRLEILVSPTWALPAAAFVVVWSNVRPTFFFVSVTSVISVFNVFDQIYALTKGGPSGSTEVLAYLIYKEAFETGNVGRAAVMACVMMLLLMGLTLAQNLYFRKRTTYELV